MANEFVTFNPYDEQLEKLRRRQRMADMLQQQAMQPLESQTAPGGYVVPTSPLLGLAKMLQAYSAGKTQRGIDTELADIRSRMGEEQRTREAEIESAGKAIQGRMFDRPAPAPVAQMPETGDQLQEITPTAQYQYDPQGAFQAAMTPAGAAAMQKSPMLASMLANMMKPGDAEEFYAPTEVDGKLVQFGKLGGVKESKYAPPKKEPDQMTPYQQQMIGLREKELEARTKGLAGAGESVAQTAVDKRKYRDTRLQLQNAYDSLGEFARELQNTPKGASLVGEAAGRLSSKYKLALGAVRTLQNTGVLNPGELPFIEDTLRNPQSISQLLNPASRDAISGQIDAIANLLEKQSSRNDESIGYDLAPLKDSDWRKKAASATTNFGAPPPGAVRRKTP